MSYKKSDRTVFWAEIVSGNLILREHEAAKWLAMEELNSVDWLPADVMVVEKVRDRLQISLEKK